MDNLSTNQLLRLVDIRDGKPAKEDMLGVGLQAAGYLRQGDWGLTMKAHNALTIASTEQPVWMFGNISAGATSAMYSRLADAMVDAIEESNHTLLVGVWEVYSGHLQHIVYQGEPWERKHGLPATWVVEVTA